MTEDEKAEQERMCRLLEQVGLGLAASCFAAILAIAVLGKLNFWLELALNAFAIGLPLGLVCGGIPLWTKNPSLLASALIKVSYYGAMIATQFGIYFLVKSSSHDAAERYLWMLIIGGPLCAFAMRRSKK